MTARDQLADVIEDAIDSVHDMDVTHRDYANAAAYAVLGMIKPLEWKEHPDWSDHLCASNYEIAFSGNGLRSGLHYHGPVSERLLSGDVRDGLLDEFKAAANAHHRAQILAALGLHDIPG